MKTEDVSLKQRKGIWKALEGYRKGGNNIIIMLLQKKRNKCWWMMTLKEIDYRHKIPI